MTQEIFRNARKPRNGFTTVVNPMLDNEGLSLEAKGLITILISNSETWKLQMKDIIKRSYNGRDQHYHIINELILEGYFARVHVLRMDSNLVEKIIYIYSDRIEEVQNQIEEEITILKQENRKYILEDFQSKKFLQKKFPKKLQERVDAKLKMYQDQGIYRYPEFQDADIHDTEFKDINNTKVKKTNLKNTKSSKYVSTHPDFSAINVFKENYKLTKYAKTRLESFVETHGEELTKLAVERTVKKGKEENMVSYIDGMLKKWDKIGLKSVGEIEAYEKHYWEAKKEKASKQKNQGKQSYNMKKSKLPVSIKLAEEETAAGLQEKISDEDQKALDDALKTFHFLRSTEKQVLHNKE